VVSHVTNYLRLAITFSSKQLLTYHILTAKYTQQINNSHQSLSTPIYSHISTENTIKTLRVNVWLISADSLLRVIQNVDFTHLNTLVGWKVSGLEKSYSNNSQRFTF